MLHVCFSFVSVSLNFPHLHHCHAAFYLTLILQWGNNVPVPAACHLVACVLHNPKLTELVLDYAPSDCVRHAAWQGEGLPLPPSDAVAEGWKAVLKFLRVLAVFARAVGMCRARDAC